MSIHHFKYKGKIAPNVSNSADPWLSTIAKDILEGRSNVAITARKAGVSVGMIYNLLSGKTKRPQRLGIDNILRANGSRMAIVPMAIGTPIQEVRIIPKYNYVWSPKDIVPSKTGKLGTSIKALTLRSVSAD